jgi:enoyl-CoA hydratase/carnithine racemase
MSLMAAMNPAAVSCTVDSGLALVTFQDLGQGNKLNPSSIAGLRQAFEQAVGDPSVKVIALRGGGKPGEPFCLGMDLGQLGGSLTAGSSGTADPAAEAGLRRATVEAYGALLERMANCPKPVLAFVGGPAKAGGVGLVAACDVVFASASASFELSEVLFGLIPANVIPWLIGRRMSLQKARYLILGAVCLDATQAMACGLVDQICADETADSTVKSFLKTLMRAEPGALAETKAFLESLGGLSADRVRPHAVDTLLRLMERPETATAIKAFAEGSSPPWFQKFKPAGSLFWRKDVRTDHPMVYGPS